MRRCNLKIINFSYRQKDVTQKIREIIVNFLNSVEQNDDLNFWKCNLYNYWLEFQFWDKYDPHFFSSEQFWLTPKLAKEIDGCYIRMLRAVLNVHWKQHITNKELYGELPKLSDKIRQRRLRFAGHCSRSQQELLHWTPKHGRRKPGRPALNYSDILKQETGMESTELRTAMKDRKIWRAMIVRGHHST